VKQANILWESAMAFLGIKSALSQANPVDALKQIGGASFASRIARVDQCVQQPVRKGTITHKVYEDLIERRFDAVRRMLRRIGAS
jgi:hypothetical protein